MMFMKRTAVAVMLLLAPAQALAGDMVYESAKELALVLGEVNAATETCSPNSDRSGTRKVRVLETVGQVLSDREAARVSLSYDLGRAHGMGGACTLARRDALLKRMNTAFDDFGKSLERIQARLKQSK
jgi:hypothetical protein